MNERGTSGWRSISQSEILRIGGGKVFGFLVPSHSSGKFKMYDGFDDVLAVKANSTLTISSITPAVHATNTITSSGVNVSDGDTVVIGAITYRFKNTMALAYDVKIGADAETSLANLKKAINGTGTAGTEYFAGTVAHTLVIGATLTATTLKIYSRTYGTGNNTLGTTETAVTLSWADTTLGGGTGASDAGVATAGATFNINGTDYYFTTELSETVLGSSSAVANEILWVTSDAVALDNMKLAINGTGVEGTDYSTGTNANAYVIATTNGNTTQVIEARNWGIIGNEITTTETMGAGAWTSTTLTGGVNGARLMCDEFTLATGSSILTLPEPMEFVNGLYINISSGTAVLTPIWKGNS